MEFKRHRIKKEIHPGKMRYDNTIYNLLKIPNRFIIDSYTVLTVDGKIDKVTIIGQHPNSNPRTDELCIPNHIRKFEFNDITQKMIENVIFTFNFDDCYFAPWDEIEYKKQIVSGAG